MALRRYHYEHAFEEYLRVRRIPYVAVDEAKKALIPEGEGLKVNIREQGRERPAALKSFDFVVYGQGQNLLLEVKGRRIGRRAAKSVREEVAAAMRPPPRGRLETWVTTEDIESLKAWMKLFGPEFEAVFVFLYWCEEQPPDALFEEIFEHRGKWYAVRAITLRDYATVMRVRSTRWGTVHVGAADFDRLSGPLAPPAVARHAAPVDPPEPAFLDPHV